MKEEVVMQTVLDLTSGIDSFTHLDLLRKAATHKGLELQGHALKAYSEKIKIYQLDTQLLAILSEHNIKQHGRPDCGHEIFTLVDENPQKKVPGWAPSNYWNFRLLEGSKCKFDLRVTLSVSFSLNFEKRGVVLVPQARGSFVSPADQLPNFRMFKALVDNDMDVPNIAKELAQSDEGIVVSWTELGLGGIKKLSYLFSEFTGQNQAVAQLGRNRAVFDPTPNPPNQSPDDELFIMEPAQPKVTQAWQTQLNEYRNRLIL